MENRMRELRMKLGLTQCELAAMAGISRVTVNRVERGTHIPDGKTILRIAKALGHPASQVFVALSAD